MRAGDVHKLPAGGALAVDRDGFAAAVQMRCKPRCWSRSAARRCRRCRCVRRPCDRRNRPADLARARAVDPARDRRGRPRVLRCDRADRASRQHRLRGGVAAVPLRQARPGRHRRRLRQLSAGRGQYRGFVEALGAGAKHEFKEWETSTPYFEGCLPIEVMAERGADTLRYGPMKPVGLVDPRTGRRPFAVVQLRQDNALGTLSTWWASRPSRPTASRSASSA